MSNTVGIQSAKSAVLTIDGRSFDVIITSGTIAMPNPRALYPERSSREGRFWHTDTEDAKMTVSADLIGNPCLDLAQILNTK